MFFTQDGHEKPFVAVLKPKPRDKQQQQLQHLFHDT